MTDQLPVKWDEELAKMANASAALERPSVGRLSIRGGILSYQGNPVPGNKVSVVIVNTSFENALYQNVLDNRPFNAQQPEAPICYALSMTGEREGPPMAPHPLAKQKQSDTCDKCKWNAWGSNPAGGRGKACKQSRRMLLLGVSSVQDKDGRPAPLGAVKKAEAATLSVPVTSVKNWANYVSHLAAQFGRPPWSMVTELSVHPHAKFQLEVKFEPIAKVDESHLSHLWERVKSGESIVMTPYSTAENAPQQAPLQNRRY